MISAGIDLAAEPKGTALALIEFSNNKAKLYSLEQGLDDNALIANTHNADKVGIDCAFGWPIQFAQFVNNHQDLSNKELIDGGMDYRRELSFRETDREIKRLTGRWPLSVSTDRLGLTAIRCAGLLSKYQAKGIEIDRSGAKLLVEVYPGATLRNWKLDTTGYRINPGARAKLLEQLELQAPWLELATFRTKMIESADCFDAVIASLAARAVYLGDYNKPTSAQIEMARVEGWICLPGCGLQGLPISSGN
jgi:predicted nuclease with RNAse H fold